MSKHDDNIHTNQTGPLVVVLAGGAARRMGGIDKGEVVLSGRRLVDHVVDKLTIQTDRIIFSGTHSYGFNLPAVEDREDGPNGPAAGLWAALGWIKENLSFVDGFYTVPVDGPFLPEDLLKCLGDGGDCAVAVDENGIHPTFAYWKKNSLIQALAHSGSDEGIALRRIAENCGAKQVSFPSDGSLMNINTSSDLHLAENLMRSV